MTRQEQINLLKNTSVALSVAAMLGLTGCKSNSDSNIATNSATEVTTTTESTTQATEEILEVAETINYTEKAQNLYNQYQGYFDYVGLVSVQNDKKDYTKIENIIKLLNNDVKGLSDGEVEEASNSIQSIEIDPDLLYRAIFTVNNKDNSEEYEFVLPEYPKLSQVVIVNDESDKKVVESLESYEQLRDSVREDIITNKKVSDLTKQKLQEKVINNYYNSYNELDAGNYYVQKTAEYSTVRLTNLVVGYKISDTVTGDYIYIGYEDYLKETEIAERKDAGEILTEEENNLLNRNLQYKLFIDLCNAIDNIEKYTSEIEIEKPFTLSYNQDDVNVYQMI